MTTRTLRVSVLLVCLMVAGLASASSLEVARLAQQLEHISQDLASDTAARSWSGSVRHNAKLLSEKARKLQDSIERGRSSAYVRTRFTDVSRYYQRLEASVVRSVDGSGSHRLRDDFLNLADAYEELRYEFYGDTGYQSLRTSPPVYGYRNGYPAPLYWPGDRYSRDAGVNVIVVPTLRFPNRSHPDQGWEGRHRSAVESRANKIDDNNSHRSPVQDRQFGRDRARDLPGSRGSADRQEPNPGGRLRANQGYYRLGQ